MESMTYKSPYAAMGSKRAVLPPATVTQRVALSYAPEPRQVLALTIPPVTAQPAAGLHYTIPPRAPTTSSAGLHYTISPTTPGVSIGRPTTYLAMGTGKMTATGKMITGEKEPMKWYTWILIAVGAVLVIRALKK